METTIRLEVTDGFNPIMDKLKDLSRGVALEGLSVAGSHVKDAARSQFKKSAKHRWAQKIAEEKGVLGRRRIMQTESPNNVFGRRMSHKTGETDSPDSMAAFITSHMMEKSMVVVIGGRHKKSKQQKYENGEFRGYTAPIGPITKEAHAILEKLNSGERNEHHKWKEGKKSIKNFDGKWHGRQFMSKGFFSAQAAVSQALTKRLLQNLDKAIKRVEIREKKVV
jgi:hypothetical protein